MPLRIVAGCTSSVNKMLVTAEFTNAGERAARRQDKSKPIFRFQRLPSDI